MGLVDVNLNSGYEFATLREMTGGTVLRGSSGEQLSPNLLPLSLDSLDIQGRMLKSGYYYQLFLPDAAGDGIPETPAQIGNIDASLAEGYWTMLAWPASRNQSGTAAYFVNQQGEVVKTRTANYSGLTATPPAGAALMGTGGPTEIVSNSVAVNAVGADGNTWTSVR